jgi:thiol-disulfide isomerase/thioredoxin
MAENISILIKWSDLFNPESLQHFLLDMRNLDITNSIADNDFKQTSIEGLKSYSRSNLLNEIDLIPNEVVLKQNRAVQFSTSKRIELKLFPKVVEFVKNYCPYIYDFMQDQNIETVEVFIKISANYPNDLDVINIKINDYLNLKDWIQKDSIELTPFILAALIKNFYNQNQEPFGIKTSSALLRIKQYINHVISLFDKNINLLKEYIIDKNNDECLMNHLEFNFLDNMILKTNKFDLYEQNLDMKFLSYINRSNLREKLVNAETNSNIL